MKLVAVTLLCASRLLQAQAGESEKIPRLFRAETPAEIRFSANWKKLRDDKEETSPYRSATLSYKSDTSTVSVPLKVKTHGVWRLKHCEFPPLRLNFGDKSTKGTLFHDLQKPKMVSVCRNSDEYEQLVLREMQLYRIYQVLTPQSHRIRTLHIVYADSATGKVEATRYAFLFEDPDELADRLGGTMGKTKGAGGNDLDPHSAAIVYLFQYLIANTDFSFNGLHNGELVLPKDGSELIPVAYDFDFAGAVNAPYATADPRLNIRRVRDRLYRGYCVLKAENPKAAALFRDRKAAIYALYRDPVGKLIEERTSRETLSYFDEFYDLIKTDANAEKYVFSGCIGTK